MKSEDIYEGVAEKRFDLVMDHDHTAVHPRVKKVVLPKKTGGMKYLSLAGELGFDIALPMVGGLIIGTKLDARFGTVHAWTIGLFMFGLVLSCASLIRIVRDVTRKA